MSSERTHLGDELYGDRHQMATDNGILSIDQVVLKEIVNNHKESVREAYWRATCPVCYREHEVDGGGEDAREKAIDSALECCDSEWLPPQDWVEDCSICGEDHREVRNCVPPSRRDPFIGADADYRCAVCEWDGPGDELTGPRGTCPECGSTAVQVIEE